MVRKWLTLIGAAAITLLCAVENWPHTTYADPFRANWEAGWPERFARWGTGENANDSFEFHAFGVLTNLTVWLLLIGVVWLLIQLAPLERFRLSKGQKSQMQTQPCEFPDATR
jgi:hypothetical protein